MNIDKEIREIRIENFKKKVMESFSSEDHITYNCKPFRQCGSTEWHFQCLLETILSKQYNKIAILGDDVIIVQTYIEDMIRICRENNIQFNYINNGKFLTVKSLTSNLIPKFIRFYPIKSFLDKWSCEKSDIILIMDHFKKNSDPIYVCRTSSNKIIVEIEE